MRLLIAGGGTGGHLFPGIAVAEEFLSRDPANEVLFVGTERGIEARLLPRLGYRLETITASGLKGMGGVSQLKGLIMLINGYAQSRRVLKEFKPDIVLGVGGYASAPAVLAARGMLIPRFIHEQNAIPGLTNKFLARVAERVFISLEESRKFFPKEKVSLTGNPLRRAILARVAQEGVADRDKMFRLLIFGGSAGAHSINMAAIASLPHLAHLRERLVVTHQTGDKDLGEVQKGYAEAGFNASVLPFIDDMAAAYQEADLVICRAGATTIAEITACGKACLFIPYPYAADDHQTRNAEALVEQGAGFIMEDGEMSGERLSAAISELEARREKVKAAAEAARGLARPDAARIIVDEMLDGKNDEQRR